MLAVPVLDSHNSSELPSVGWQPLRPANARELIPTGLDYEIGFVAAMKVARGSKPIDA